MPQVWPLLGGQRGVGVTTISELTAVFVPEVETEVVAPKPERARTRTKLRTRKVDMMCVTPD
jgi:hypothetical protein